jgi:hypothetical protein
MFSSILVNDRDQEHVVHVEDIRLPYSLHLGICEKTGNKPRGTKIFAPNYCALEDGAYTFMLPYGIHNYTQTSFIFKNNPQYRE